MPVCSRLRFREVDELSSRSFHDIITLPVAYAYLHDIVIDARTIAMVTLVERALRAPPGSFDGVLDDALADVLRP